MLKPFAIVLVFLTTLMVSTAQNVDFGSELAVSFSKEFGRGWEWNVDEEVRLNQNSMHYCKSETSAGLDYALWRDALDVYGLKMKIGANYAFINRYNNDNYYENQNRLNLNFNVAKEYGYWKLALRSRLQTTYRDENHGNYSWNPKMYLREKLELSYEFPTRPWKFFVSEETFLRLNNPQGNYIDEWRTRIGTTYRVNRNSRISLYLKMANEWQVKNPQSFYAVGLEYEFK